MNKKVNILSIDGGGIRGIIPAKILAYLEQGLQHKTGNPNVSLADYFDMIAGTSTGGILSCFYLLPPKDGQKFHSRFSAADAEKLYMERGKEIFKLKAGKPFIKLSNLFSEKYVADGLESVLEEVMGDVTLAQSRKQCVVTAYDITSRKAVFFTSPQAREHTLRDFYLKDVARATSAAPTYFKLAEVSSLAGETFHLIDGAMFASDPTLCAIVEARKSVFEKCKHPSISDLFVVSIGTGKEAKRYDYKKASKWGIAGWAVPVLNIMMSSSAEVVSYQVKQLFEVAGYEKNYLRMEPGLCRAKPDMDDVSSENLRNLKDAGFHYITENIKQLDHIIDTLIRNSE